MGRHDDRVLDAVGAVLGSAVGAAISPVPIIALVLVLLSDRAAANGLAFLLGWAGGLAVLGAVVLLVDPGGDPGTGSAGPTTVATTIRLVVGTLFLVAAWRQVVGRPRPGTEPVLPAWMSTIGSMAPPRVLGVAAALAVVNPKNLGLTIAAGSDIAAADLGAGGQATVLGVFVVVASLSVVGPVVYAVAAGERARPLLDGLRDWLAANGWAVMVVLFVVLGARLLGEGLAGLG